MSDIFDPLERTEQTWWLNYKPDQESKSLPLTEHHLPISITKQDRLGCVTASARSFIPLLTQEPFEPYFLPFLREKFSFSDYDLEQNHMLGIASVAAQNDLSVHIHRSKPLEEDTLPLSVSSVAKSTHPSVVREIIKQRDWGEIGESVKHLTSEDFGELLKTQNSLGRYGMILVDWAKWNPGEPQASESPRHIITCFGVEGNKAYVLDTARNINENPVVSEVSHLYDSLTEIQQIVFIGPEQATRTEV